MIETAHGRPRRARRLAGAFFFHLLLPLLLTASAQAEEGVVATIKVSSATAGSSLSGRLVEGVMEFRDAEYLLTLRGLAKSANSTGTVQGLVRSRDIQGFYEPTDQGLRNSSGVTIRFDPPLELAKDRLQIELSSRRTPKVSGGHRESGVE
jgi:hypothetical protein